MSSRAREPSRDHDHHGSAAKWIWLVAVLVVVAAIGVLSVFVPVEWRWPELR